MNVADATFDTPNRGSAQNLGHRGAPATGRAEYENASYFWRYGDGASRLIPLIIHIVNDA
jgi:hypothetical protein